jgi:hypothetical protein
VQVPPQQVCPSAQQEQVLPFGFAASVLQQPYWPGGQLMQAALFVEQQRHPPKSVQSRHGLLASQQVGRRSPLWQSVEPAGQARTH